VIRVSYDSAVDALYIRLADGRAARTPEVDSDPCTLVDLDGDGNLIGIEVIGTQRPWPLHKILAAYDISDEDATMLMAAYPSSAWVLL
jgi:uncharacterized protein YuzE